MKRLRLYSKLIYPRGTGVVEGQEQKPVKATSVDLLKFSLEGNLSNIKGIERLTIATKIISKLNLIERSVVEVEKGCYVDLEDAEFDLLRESVNSAEFPPIVLHFPELLTSIVEASSDLGMGLSMVPPHDGGCLNPIGAHKI